MRETVADLRDGWYGNVYWLPPEIDGEGMEIDNSVAATIRGNEGIRILPVNCKGLILVAIKEANKRIAWCPGIQGSIEDGVTVEPGYNADAAIPIDLLFDASLGDEHNPVLLQDDIPGEHHLEDDESPDDSEDAIGYGDDESESEDAEVAAAAGLMGLFACAAESVPVAPGHAGPSENITL